MPLTEEERKERRRETNRINNRAYRKRHKDRVASNARKYYTSKKGKETTAKRTLKNKDNMNQYRADNKDAIKETNRQYVIKHRTQINEWKKKYYRENKEAVCSRAKEDRDTLSDSYIRALICTRSIITSEHIPQSLIQAKRLELQMKRYSKEQENGK